MAIASDGSEYTARRGVVACCNGTPAASRNMLRFELTITGQDTVTHALREAAAVLPRQVVNTTYDWAELHVMRLSVGSGPTHRSGPASDTNAPGG
jgi:hypothetical protein